MDIAKESLTVRERARQVVAARSAAILQGWLDSLHQDGQLARIDRPTLEDICARLLRELAAALAREPAPGPAPGRQTLPPAMGDLLSGISSDFVERGLAPSHAATFIFSLKHQVGPLLFGDVEAQLAIYDMIDAMGLYSMDAFIARREQLIKRQTQELLDISVPVVPLWEGVLSLPIIGTLDSGRAQAITEKLLLELARTASRHALLDISGVPTVDTQTAQYLAKTVAAARLMGAECVITGIRPAIAQTMVALGIDLAAIETRFSMAEGLRYCLSKQGVSIQRREV
jgi:rsbT co-antagonist protein RsbR